MVQITRETGHINLRENLIKWGLVVLMSVMAMDLLYLNYRMLSLVSKTEKIGQEENDVNKKIESDIEPSVNYDSLESNDIREIVKSATASLTLEVEKINKTLGQNKSTSIPPSTARARELYIPLGTGQTSSTEWVDLPGVEAYVVPTNYGVITGFYFDAGIRVPTGSGRVYARLRNVTDNVGLVESEVYQEGTDTGLVSSGRIPIPTTTKLYRVQLKSSIGATVVLDNARIKLFVE